MAPEHQAGLVLEEALAPLRGCQRARHPHPVNWMGPAQFRGHSSNAKDPGGVRGSGEGASHYSPHMFSMSPEVPTPLEPELGAGLWGPCLACTPSPPLTTSGRVACHWDLPGCEGLPPRPCRWPPPPAGLPVCRDPPARHRHPTTGTRARLRALPPQLLGHSDFHHPVPSECLHEGQVTDRRGRAWGGSRTSGPWGWAQAGQIWMRHLEAEQPLWGKDAQCGQRCRPQHPTT